MGGGVRCINPAGGQRAGVHIQPHQLGHPQAAAVQQLTDGVVAGLQGGVVGARQLLRQRHRLVHIQGLGQRFGRFGRADAVHRVVQHQPLTAPVFEQATPGRQRDGNAAWAQATLTQLRDPAANMVGLRLLQHHRFICCQLLQPSQRVGVHHQRAAGQAALHPQMLQKAADGLAECRAAHVAGQSVGQSAAWDDGNRRVSPALATSPTRIKKSVAISAL